MATVLNEAGFPFVDTSQRGAFPTVLEPKEDAVIKQDTLLGEPFPIVTETVKKRSRANLMDALTSGGKLEVFEARYGGLQFSHRIGRDAFEEEELGHGPSTMDVVKGFVSDLLVDGKKIPSISGNEFKETVGTSFNKSLFTLMNLAGGAISTYLANKPVGMDFTFQNEKLTDVVNRGIHSVGLDALSSFSLLALGAVDLLLLSVLKQKKSIKQERDIWHINTATAVISAGLIGIIGNALAEDPTLVQKLVQNILVK